MGYQILPNIIFILAVLGIIAIVLRRLPEAANLSPDAPKEPAAEERLISKGLPAIAISKIKTKLKYLLGKIWHFMLEAKDLKQTSATGYKIKKLFSMSWVLSHRSSASSVSIQTDLKDEKYFLRQIKLEPKNLAHYDALGKFYTEQKKFTDAKDIYDYLVNHNAGSGDYRAKLAYCFYQLQDYKQAIDSYQKSVALDSTHPNRYYNLGLCYSTIKDFVQAKLAFQKALEMEPANEKYKKALEKTDLEIQSDLIRRNNQDMQNKPL